MKCFMDCEPPDDGGQEAFYVAVLPELTIYGHTINAWTRTRYPEDWQHVRDTQARGIHWGCWHSVVEPEGEIGSQDPAICWPMEKVAMMLHISLPNHELMNRFAELGWPDLQIHLGLTANRPLIRILEPSEGEDLLESMRRGTLREAWDSLEGDKRDGSDTAT